MSFFDSISSESTPEAAADRIPSWMLAADNHNLGNTQGGSWFDPETWGEKFQNAGKLIATGFLSGANSFYNTGVTVGNWLGGEAEKNDTATWISGIDSDLGVYYKNNTGAADLVGFIAGSLIPGIGGIKVLNAGQKMLMAASKKGILGSNLGRATGLLVPQTDAYIASSISTIKNSAATFNTLNAGTVKALASGVWQNTLEAAAFETAVQATMFKSPVLENQDMGDIVKNIAIGGLVGGVIGGAFSAAGTLGKINAGVKAFDKELKPSTSRAGWQETNDPAAKIILMTEDAEGFKLPVVGEDAFDTKMKSAVDRKRRNDNDIRTQVHKMTVGEDAELGNLVADSIYGLPSDQVLNNFLHGEQLSRIGAKTKVETELAKAAKAEEPIDPSLQLGYVKLTGEGAGVVTDSEPILLNIADKAKGAEEINDFVRQQKFKPGANWSVLNQSGRDAHLDVEARYIWADKLLHEIKPETSINQYDIPVLERLLKDAEPLVFRQVKLIDDAGGVLQEGFQTRQDIFNHLIKAKDQAANQLMQSHVLEGSIPVEQGTQAIAKMVNTSVARLEGSSLLKESDDYFAWQTANTKYMQELQAKGLSTPANAEADVRFLPSYAKISRRIPMDFDVDGNVVDGMTWIKTQQKQAKQAVDNVVARHAGELAAQIPEYSDAQLLMADRTGAGAGALKFANGNYGSPEAVSQLLGSQTKQLEEKFRQATSDGIAGPASALRKNQEAAIEYTTLKQKVSRSAQQWIRHTDPEDGLEYLITKDAATKYTDPVEGTIDFDALNSTAPEQLLGIHTPEAAAFIDARLDRTGYHTQLRRELRAAQGFEDVKDPGVVRFDQSNPQDYPYFAFVKDPRVTEQGHTSMIFANTEEKLNQLIDKVPAEYRVVTKRDAEEFHTARGDYEFQRTLHENYIDHDLKNKGIYSEFFTKTDPGKIVDDATQDLLRADSVSAKELMRAKNQKAFQFFEDQGAAYTKIEASKFASNVAEIERSGKNPYTDQIKTALNISKINEMPLWKSFNMTLDQAVSKVVGRISDQFAGARSAADLEVINSTIDHYGMNTGFRDAALDLLVNHTAPRGELTKFVRGANAIMSKLTLGLDPLNAVNNAIGANVLRGAELTQLTRAIASGDTNLAGELGNLARIAVPGTGDSILSPSKLVAGAIQNFFKDDGQLVARYKSLGVIKDATEQFKSILDDFTLKGTEVAGELSTRLNSAFAKARELSLVGEKYTGNKFAEEFNRFISADCMRQLTDLGVARNLLSPAEQNVYINTFVNRVEGNIIASQRPLMFQGPIGQAIGLFQTYQFNLMQQMFRYVAEGSSKDTAMLLGLQGTFYGIQGLPAFQFINQHIIGTASGNSKHVDAYDATLGIAGKQAGEFLLYGLPANLLQANIYSRGDINPRQLTVLPSSLKDIPIVSAMGSLYSSIKDTVGRIGGGANVWESMLQGLEHNGISRPLAGLAQTLQATTGRNVPFSTTSQGSILMSNDLMSWATATRIAGGKPLDEALVNDAVFRIHSYEQFDRSKMKELSESIKASSISGQVMDNEQVMHFAKTYAENGGKQAQFNKFMLREITQANTSKGEQIVHQLQNPFAQKLQLLMGGASQEY